MLSPKQQEAVRHCIVAAKRKGTKGMRFTSEWILEYILMKMNSPKLYKNLRINNILVLPSNTAIEKIHKCLQRWIWLQQENAGSVERKDKHNGQFQVPWGSLV